MLGAIIGDIAGSRFEFHNHKSTDFELFTLSCRPTDDSTMTLAVALALLRSGGDRNVLPQAAITAMRALGGKYRYRIIMKCKNNAEMRGYISGVLTESAKLKEMKGIALYADMNGDVGV